MIKRKLVGILSLALFSSVAVLGSNAIAAPGQNNGKAAIETRKKEKADFLKANPNLANELKALKDLPKEQRKAKMQELKNKYPEFAQKFKNKKGKRAGRLQELAKSNPQLASELKALKDLPKEQRKAKMQEIRQKYNLPAKK